MDTKNLIKHLRQERDWSQQRLADEAHVVRPVISRAEKERRGLSVEASESLGEVLDVDPLALFISSQVAATVAKAEHGEISASSALASMSRVIGTVAKMHKAGELTASPELTEAVELLSAAITELSSETGESVQKFTATIERCDGGMEDDGRDPLGRRVEKSAGPSLRPGESYYPLHPMHQDAPATTEELEEQYGVAYDDGSDGRDHLGLRIAPLGEE